MIIMIMIIITLVINTITISIIFHHDNVVNNVRVHLCTSRTYYLLG